jgi:hypothetical protein
MSGDDRQDIVAGLRRIAEDGHCDCWMCEVAARAAELIQRQRVGSSNAALIRDLRNAPLTELGAVASRAADEIERLENLVIDLRTRGAS